MFKQVVDPGNNVGLLQLESRSGVVSTEDTDEIWKAAKEEAMKKVKGRRANRLVGTDSPMVQEEEVEKSF